MLPSGRRNITVGIVDREKGIISCNDCFAFYRVSSQNPVRRGRIDVHRISGSLHTGGHC